MIYARHKLKGKNFFKLFVVDLSKWWHEDREFNLLYWKPRRTENQINLIRFGYIIWILFGDIIKLHDLDKMMASITKYK